MNRKTSVALVAAAISAAVALAGCASSSSGAASSSNSSGSNELAAIKKAGVITVGMSVDPPFVIQNPNGSWSSFNPTLIDLMAKNLGVKVDFIPTTGNTMVAGLQAGQYDIIGLSISATAAREKAIDFTIPYAYGGNSWLVAKSSGYSTLSDLNTPNVTVAYNANTFQATATSTYLPKAQTRALTSGSYADLVSEITSGASNAISVPSFLASAIVDKYPSLKAIPAGDKGIDPTGVAWGVPKGQSALLNYLNGFLEKETKNGTLSKLYAQDITVANALK